VQSLEDAEQLVDVLHVEADAIVSNHEDRLPILYLVTNFDNRVQCTRLRPCRCIPTNDTTGTGKLDSVGQQVL
jgi:hypothetical protein